MEYYPCSYEAKRNYLQCRLRNLNSISGLPEPNRSRFLFSPLPPKVFTLTTGKEPTPVIKRPFLPKSYTLSSLDTNYNKIIRENSSLRNLKEEPRNDRVRCQGYLKVGNSARLNERPPNKYSEAAEERRLKRAKTAGCFMQDGNDEEDLSSENRKGEFLLSRRRRASSAASLVYNGATGNWSQMSMREELAMKPTGKFII